LHPTGDFPHISLLALGVVSAIASFLPLDAVIAALVCTRIVVQFRAQIAALQLIRRRGRPIPTFRMALYPLPSILALIGWVFILATSGMAYIAVGLGTLAAGVFAYYLWSQLPRK
jgi:basic amino acid/polyamine antiporter, APA family